MTKEKKVHVLNDETLGGIKREYVEVDRKAKAGDYVHVTYFDDKSVSEIRKITKVDYDEYDTDIIDGYYLSEGIEGEDYFGCNIGDKCAVLEPTDIVIIGGKRYRIEERLAEPGELILNKKNGLTSDVKDVAGDFIIVGDSQLMLEEDYVVLKRIDAPQSQDDIIANLVRRVSDLERKNERLETELTDAKSDIETWAQEVEALKHAQKPKQITLDVGTLAKLLGGVRG